VQRVRDILTARAGEEMALNDRYLNPQLGRIVRTLGFDRTWVRGEGPYLIDDSGARYLDLLCGYGVFALGRNHPDVVEAMHDVLEARTANLPQLGVTLLSGALAEALVERAPAGIEAVVPANSGTEAVEAAIKLARATTGRPRVLFAEHAFHGLSLGALSLNGNAEFRDGFGPLLPGCDPVPFGDLDALERELAQGDVAALVVEPVQGKGVNLPPDGYLRGAQERCHAAGALLCCDEVQTGLGRTGRLLALEHWDLQPDLICLATLRVLEREGLVEHAARMGELLLELTQPLVDRYEIVRDVRGLGLMWAIELGPPSGRAARSMWSMGERAQPGLFAQLVTVPLFHEHRILCQVAGHGLNVVKALPALVVSEEDVRSFAAALDDVLAGAERVPRAYARFGVRMARGLRRTAT
jgi:acetylornithine/succinyldiaminopimelate/putrescine aminotransferase